jgi:hypothetical protein
VDDVIKNTNTKIVHRLFAADDRNTIGDTMALSDEQKDFLPLLKPGEAIIYGGGWHAPVWVKIKETQNTRDIVSEEHIRSQGKRQLWEQRDRLLPHTSRYEFWTGDLLSAYMQEGSSALNVLLKFVTKKHNHFYDTFKAKIAKVNGGWQPVMQQMLPELLSDLLIDTVSTKDLAAWRNEAISVFKALLESQDAYQEALKVIIDGAPKNKEFNDELVQISSI